MSTVILENESQANKTDEFPQKYDLPIDSLHLENFRCFRDLDIPVFGNVNLITGKNNIGKTTFLEAIWILTKKGLPHHIENIMINRGEMEYDPRQYNFDDFRENNTIKDFSNLFKDGHIVDNGIVISSKTGRKVVAKYKSVNNSNDMKSGFYFLHGDSEETIQMDGFRDYSSAYYRDISDLKHIHSIFISSSGLDPDILLNMWDEIELTPKEDFIVQIMRIIDTRIVRVDFKGVRKIPYVRLENGSRALPLASLGGGSVASFSIGLSMLSVSDGVFLIDEIENGIHYSALENIWGFIFYVSRRFNVQVFATTHSKECIEAFQKVSAQDDNSNSGMLIRLANRDGDIVATNFDEEELEVMVRRGLEVR